MIKRIPLTLMALGALASVGQAQITMATFADPSNGSQFLFDWDMTANTLTGSWTDPGLDLLTPGLIGGGQVTGAKFNTSVINLTPVINNVLYQMGEGVITFTDAANSPVFIISFEGGVFQNPTTAGAASAQGNAVRFSGPNVPNGLFDESFSFSLANPTQNGDHMMFTASFTSSASVVPEPASILALGAGLAAVLKRRRKA